MFGDYIVNDVFKEVVFRIEWFEIFVFVKGLYFIWLDVEFNFIGKFWSCSDDLIFVEVVI